MSARDLRFWVSIPELAGVSLPVGMPVWDLARLDRHPVPIIGYSEAGPLITCRSGDDVVFAIPGANRAICLAEPVRDNDGAPLWLDALPWAVAAIVARRGVQARGPDKVADYAEKISTARWAAQALAEPYAELVSDHRRVFLVRDLAPSERAAGSAVEVRGLVNSSDVANAPWPYGVPMAAPPFGKPSPAWTRDMPADASHVAALRLTIAAALREGVLRRDSAQLVGNGAA